MNLKQSREYLDEQFKMNGYGRWFSVMNTDTSPRKNVTLVNRTMAKFPMKLAEYARYFGVSGDDAGELL